MNIALLNEVLSQVCKNPYWKEYYENAPTDKCKYYIALGFLLSQPEFCIDQDEIRNEKKSLEDSFEFLDWKHLYTYSGHNPLRCYYRNKMEQTRNNTSSE